MNNNLPLWGLLPDQVIQLVKRREWDNIASLKARLLGEKAFPLRIGLKPPNGHSALSDVEHFLRFIAEWKAFPHQEMVQWEIKSFRNFSDQNVPTFIVVNSVKQLMQLLGRDAHERSQLWERNMALLLNIDGMGQLNQRLYPALVRWIEEIEKLSEKESKLLAKLLPQLKQGLGKGCYLRALSVNGVDTKFLENHQALIEDLIDTLHCGAVSEAGGLLNWLGCHINPKDWLTICPLCEDSKKALGSIPILKMSSNVLKSYELPAKNILVVENLQSGLALPYMNDTIAVVGGGKNVAWMNAEWLYNKHVGYWGDIDTWGLFILSDARSQFALIESLMMDMDTLKAHEERMVVEPSPNLAIPPWLREDEMTLFNDLISRRFQPNRLEQERISSDYIRQKLQNWLSRS